MEQMAEVHADQQFVETVVEALVDHPDEVKTERTVDEMGVLITLHINPADMGQIIGRNGRTARAIRTLLRVVGAKNSARVNLKIYEPEGSFRGHRDRDRGGDRPTAGDADAPAPAPADDAVDTGVEDLNL